MFLKGYSLDLKFKYYQVQDGLSTNTIQDIIQDTQGYMWIATENGLNRFDGHEFIHYRNLPHDSSSIKHNYVYTLFEDNKGEIWIGTEIDISVYSPYKNSFKSFQIQTDKGVMICDRIQDIIQDKREQIWIASGSQGIFIYDKEKETLVLHDFNMYREENQSYIHVTCLYKDKEENIWASVNGTKYQLYKFNTQKEIFEPAFPSLESEQLKKFSAYCMLEDTFGTLWLGTWNHGVYAIHKTEGIQANYLNTEGVDKILHIHSMIEYEPGKFLIGSNDGLTYFTGTPSMGYKRERHIREPELSSCFVYPIYKDKEDGLWIGTYYGGINYASPNRNYFTYYTYSPCENSISGNVISSFLEDSKGNLWIGTDDAGLNYFNTQTGVFTHYKPEKDKNSLSFHNIHALCIDNNTLWIGTYAGGLNAMDLNTKKFKHYYSDPSDSQTLSSSSIYSLFTDSNNDLWVGTTNGINLYNRADDTFKRMKETVAATHDILQVNQTLWFATNGDGIFTYHLETKEWKQYRFEENNYSSVISNHVLCFCYDINNRIWIGTNSGLCYYETDSDSFQYITDLFDSNSISNLFYVNGVLWITTTNGLIEYDPVSGQHHFFNGEDGLASEQFTTKSGIQTSSGKIYAGTTNGFYAFYHKQLTKNRVIPPIAITGFQLFNQPVEWGDYMQTGKSGLNYIILPYNKNSFSFDFTALSCFAPQKNEHAFLLEGFDKNWNYTDKKRKATYTNILPGEYYFRVKGSNNDGVWNNEGTFIKLIVTPPFWLTTGFICIYMLLFILALLGLCLFIKRKNERKQEARIEKIKTEQEKEAYNSKINFFTSTAHEIRTPVSLIIAPLEKIISKSDLLPEKVHNDLQIINRNSQRLLSLVNQLLDFRKIEKGSMPIEFSEQNIYELLKNIYIRFKPYVENKEIDFIFTYDQEDFIACVDVENLTKVISNLLSNASKFTKDRIELILDSRNNKANTFTIIVKDNGIGIPENLQQEIFKPFYQLPDTRNSGTGLGLYLVHSIVDTCSGNVFVESTEGAGSLFYVVLPRSQSGFIQKKNESSATTYFPENKASVMQIPESLSIKETTETDRATTSLLIVEDNQEMIDFLRESLEEKFRILTAENGKAAIKVLEKNEVDLIISDIMMPEMDGVEFCNTVKSNFLWNHIPLILLTAKTNIVSKIEALEKGADAYVEKPFSISFLYAQINNLLENRKNLIRKFTETPFTSLKSIAGNKADEEFLNKVNEVIEKNISNVDFSIEQLAEELCISNSGLFAKIKNLSGMTPNKLLLLVRLKKAAELLQENRYRINEVCFMVGFNNPSYFSKCFQKQYGLPPKEFIQSRENTPQL